jgi:hypothetical protein
VAGNDSQTACARCKNALLAGDIISADPRYPTLMEADRRSVLQAALTSLEALESVDAHYTRSVVAGCGAVLAEAFADASVSAEPTR